MDDDDDDVDGEKNRCRRILFLFLVYMRTRLRQIDRQTYIEKNKERESERHQTHFIIICRSLM
mgnify:FL=1